MHINREYIMSSNTEGAHLYPNPYTSVTFGWASGVADDTRSLQVFAYKLQMHCHYTIHVAH